MIREAMPSSAEGAQDDEETLVERSPEGRRIGPLSDYADLGEEFYPEGDASVLLERLKHPRNPDEEIQVSKDRETVEAQLKQVGRLIEKEKEREGALGAVRQRLGSPHEKGGKLKELEEAKEQLEEDAKHIELAATYNDTLDSFSDLSHEEREHIEKTGKATNGKHLYDRHGEKIESDVAKELAHLYKSGGRRLTWGTTRRIGQVADKILHDVVSAVKGVFRGTGDGGGARKSSRS